MNRSFAAALCAAIICLPLAAFADDWPQFRGPNADGISAETGIKKSWNNKPPEQLWRVPLANKGYAGPSAANGKVFIIDRDGDNDVVRALDIKTGKDVWQFSYTETGEYDKQFGYARSTPAIDNGKVYTLGMFGSVNCLNEADGAVIWSRNIIKDFNGIIPMWQMAMSPFIDGDKLIVSPCGKDAAVVALDKNTGETIWQCGNTDRTGYATPVAATINGKKQYVVFHGAGLIGADAEEGEVLWTWSWTVQYFVNAATPLVFDDSVFITSNYGRGGAVVRIDGDKVTKVWENKEMQSHFSSPVLYDGHIYGTGDPWNPGFLMCLDPKTGKALWKQGGFGKGGIVVVDGTIIAFNGRSGELIMVEMSTKGYNELGRFKPLGGQSWTAPIVADGKLIVRNKEALACFQLR
jgi:outer membrane protein assembly factor BamB